MEKKDFIMNTVLAVILFGLVGYIIISLSYLVYTAIIDFGGVNAYCDKNPFGGGLIMLCIMFSLLYMCVAYIYIIDR